jgi:translation initiation factor 4A
MENMSSIDNEDIENTEINAASYEIQLWDQLEINPNLLRGIFAYGFEKPSPIQQKAIKPIILGKDVIVQAQSGTGKTATFTIGALSNIVVSNNSTQVLVLSPTKELALQTSNVFESLGRMMEGLKVKTYYGGSNVEEGGNFFKKNGNHVICGCQGRVYDMIRRDKISCKNIKIVILDEADELLSPLFKEQIYNIFQSLNGDVQVVLVSATLPDSIKPIIDKIMRNPVKIMVKREMLTLEGIKQYYVAVEDDREKYMALKNIFSHLSVSQCIIYCNSIKRVQDLYEAMNDDEFPVCRIHSNMDKLEREKSFNDFRWGKSRVLISSNVTARGIDIQQVSIVINFDLPKDVNTYLHRIGRSGRWGRKGVGINFITRRDLNKMKEIEEHYCTQISVMPNDIGFLSNS